MLINAKNRIEQNKYESNSVGTGTTTKIILTNRKIQLSFSGHIIKKKLIVFKAHNIKH